MSNAHYSGLPQNTNGGYNGDPAYKEGGTRSGGPKKSNKKWIIIGIVAIVVILAAVLGGVFGSRAAKNNSSGGSSGGSTGDENVADPEVSKSVKLELGRFATATNSQYLVPVYPSTTNTAFFTSPTFAASAQTWPEDTFKPASPNVLNVRPDRPRLLAPQYKWATLPDLIRLDPYMQGWNDTIFRNATEYEARGPVRYFMDGDSGILDVAREVKQRIKAFGYVYRMTNSTKWSDLAWAELQNAVSDTWGPAEDRWNVAHFLDTAELSAAFGIAYDWFYDIFTDDQKTKIRADLILHGLQPGLDAYNGAVFGWWRGTDTTINGNWNCVCNGGLTMASLAILGDDTTDVARQLLERTVDNAKAQCALGPSDDGTWSETPNYWYFGITGHAEMASALITATGSDYGLLDTNPGFALTALFHMYAFGPASLFDYGDHGPNKFTATANGLFLYASEYDHPEYALFQREQFDAADPWSMFWYNPAVSGAFWEGLDLDHFFDADLDQWASMRSSWTDSNALFVGIKAGRNQGHQAHNDLDVGDFVLDALGTRWAGELGSADYLSPGYFSNDSQESVRWQYYRKMTQGQNTLLIGQANQNVEAAPTIRHGSSETKQGSSTVLQVPDDSTAFWATDMTSAYFSATSVKRGVRLLNGRRQVLLQDEVNAQAAIQWRMHTNATIEADGTSATLDLNGQKMRVTILSPPEGAGFSQSPAERAASDPTPPAADQPNPGVSVLTISLPEGSHTLQVLFNPQWPGMSESEFVTPPTVALDDWSLTSHN